MRLLDFDYKTFSRENKIVVYGTEGFGRIVHYCLKKQNMIPDYYVNSRGTGYFFGVPVIDIHKLSQMYQEEHPVILLAVGYSLTDVILKLHRNGINEVYSIYSLLECAIDMGELIDPIYGQRMYYLAQQERFIECDKLILDTLDVVVTEKCSLKCEKCSNLMQYYQTPQNLNLDEIRASLDRLLEVVDCIYEFRILGGEPFMNPDFYKLIDWYKENPKIKQFVVLTNATIFPDKDKLEKLKNPKVKIWLSDYGTLSKKIRDWMAWCENNQIECLYHTIDTWHDCGNLEKHGYFSSEIKHIYAKCECRQLPTLLNGRLYNCPYAANAINLGAVTDEEAEKDMLVIDGREITKEMVREFLFDRDYLMSCDYCNGRSGIKIKPYEQTEKPLTYEKRGTGLCSC